MTTEIAVLNKLGVALATDSAVTITNGGRTKIFNSADKLFELSSIHPVAVMINGNMDCIGVPWEIVVKDFRSQLGNVPRLHIDQWMSDFIDFVGSYPGLDSQSAIDYNKQNIDREIYWLRSRVSIRLQEFLYAPGKPQRSIDNATITAWTRDAITERVKEIELVGRAFSFEQTEISEVVEEYGDFISKSIAETFAPVVLDGDCAEQLRALLAELLISKEPSRMTSGIVVAGFGSDSLFPEISQAEVGSLVLNRLLVASRDNSTLASAEDGGRVVSFAQTDVIERLLGGADPQFVEKSAEFIEIAVRDAASSIEEICRPKRISKSEIDRRQFAINSLVDALVTEYKESTAPNLRNKFTGEFDRMVAMMPKQELIELAEALVSITAVERKASSDEGTVGGPIDVALITKHDGFVWIKRKHYFRPHLNPSHFWRKYGSGAVGGDHEDSSNAS